MIAFLKFLTAFALVAILGFCAWQINAVPGSIASAQRDLERSARAAIGADDSSWASVRLDGQKAILSGEAPTARRRDALIARIAGAEGSGGIALGGVTAIDDSALTVAAATPIAAPFIFIAEHEGDVISFSGSVPDQASRDRLYRAADQLFPEAETSGSLDIADGVPVSSADWTLAAQTSLRALSQLRRGTVQAEDRAFTLTGDADDEAHLTFADSVFNELPAGLTGSVDITIRPVPASIEEIIAQADLLDDETDAESELRVLAVEGAPEDTADTPAPTTPACELQLVETIAAHEFGFDSARIDIDNRSREYLREVAASVAQCPAARIRITGHTDSSGNPARNLQLSGYRADAVRAFLVSVGAPADRLSTSGTGSSEPVAENQTPAGRERNRRIEIEVISEE